ncbi:N-acetyllactosaminide alpha-1,3-galactosyltransferase-like 1 [Hippopotamus amphibius kiboko]|uniref:N-acetyllactosaminide alpha-1,3-galactosyltransferase-like 1 n=1 Tax=Hippopotamus amphibius kiboko TaxID=575201 RepID=UPI002592D186|nr:N-acetyllactosaminide alpha-1,3-galactosyltransferase-like 1 [Hippopotamus amphibius kiboko]
MVSTDTDHREMATAAERWDQEAGEPQLSDWFNPKKRPDVITTTDWLAPVIWEGTYNRRVLEKYYKRLNITIGLAVIRAPGKFSPQDYQEFIRSANKHFMVGYNVIFYILMDSFSKLPPIALGPLRTLKALLVVKENPQEDFYFIHMKNLFNYIITHIQHEVNFLFVMTANQIFKDDFGVETLGKSVAQLSGWWYFKNGKTFPYERRRKSAAFIPFEEGDFYYHSAIFGGTVQEVLNFIKEYQKGAIQDIKNRLSSTYEHHLNKYLFIKKPTKLLSPEYNWDPSFRTPPQIKSVKIVWQSKSVGWSHLRANLPTEAFPGPLNQRNCRRLSSEPPVPRVALSAASRDAVRLMLATCVSSTRAGPVSAPRPQHWARRWPTAGARTGFYWRTPRPTRTHCLGLGLEGGRAAFSPSRHGRSQHRAGLGALTLATRPLRLLPSLGPYAAQGGHHFLLIRRPQSGEGGKEGFFFVASPQALLSAVRPATPLSAWIAGSAPEAASREERAAEGGACPPRSWASIGRAAGRGRGRCLGLGLPGRLRAFLAAPAPVPPNATSE